MTCASFASPCWNLWPTFGGRTIPGWGVWNWAYDVPKAMGGWKTIKTQLDGWILGWFHDWVQEITHILEGFSTDTFWSTSFAKSWWELPTSQIFQEHSVDTSLSVRRCTAFGRTASHWSSLGAQSPGHVATSCLPARVNHRWVEEHRFLLVVLKWCQPCFREL